MRSIARTAALLAATISLCSAAQAEPLISAFIGTPTATSKLAYFVLDFNDPGPEPETYAFGWHYEGAKLADEFPIALAESLTGANGFKEAHGDDPNFGRFFTTFGYNGRQISSVDNPNGFWQFWVGFDGTNWASSNVGASFTILNDVPLNPPVEGAQAASWTGWRWVPEYDPNVAAPAPRTPQLVAAAVPEAGTVALFGTGLGTGVVLIRRRRERR